MCSTCDIIQIVLGFLGPIVAVIIAICASRSSAKDTEKKIASIESSNAKEMAGFKELETLQAEIATINLELELWDLRFRWLQKSTEIGEVLDDQHSLINRYSDVTQSKILQLQEKERDLGHEQEFYERKKQKLEYYIERVEKLKKKLNLK